MVVPKLAFDGLNDAVGRQVAPGLARNFFGLTINTRMPYFAHSTASDIVIECTAAFAIADGTAYADPVHTQVVSVDSTLPGSPSRIHRLAAATVVWNDPFMTVPVIASKARGLSPSVWAMKFAAALFTTPVSGPCPDQIDSIASST